METETKKICQRIEIEHVRGGQPRPYAAHECVERIHVTDMNLYTGEERPEDDEEVLRIARQLRPGPMWADVDKSDMSAYFRGGYDYFTVVEPGVVEVLHRTPFTD